LEVLTVANRIEAIIKEIGVCRREIESKGNARAKSIAEYDLRLGDALRH